MARAAYVLWLDMKVSASRCTTTSLRVKAHSHVTMHSMPVAQLNVAPAIVLHTLEGMLFISTYDCLPHMGHAKARETDSDGTRAYALS